MNGNKNMIQFNEYGKGVITFSEPEAIQKQMNSAAEYHDHTYESLQVALEDFAAIHWAWQVAPILAVNGVKYTLWSEGEHGTK